MAEHELQIADVDTLVDDALKEWHYPYLAPRVLLGDVKELCHRSGRAAQAKLVKWLLSDAIYSRNVVSFPTGIIGELVRELGIDKP